MKKQPSFHSLFFFATPFTYQIHILYHETMYIATVVDKTILPFVILVCQYVLDHKSIELLNTVNSMSK